ncbi:MAG: hypothetical protein AAFX50_13135, partial [Acidobacteriota bacterium]
MTAKTPAAVEGEAAAPEGQASRRPDARVFALLLGHEKHRLALFTQSHDDPHSFLGPHPAHLGGETGVIIRAKQPRASAARLVVDDGELDMTPIGHDLFAVYVPGGDVDTPYRFRFSFADGGESTDWLRDDPYRYSS